MRLHGCTVDMRLPHFRVEVGIEMVEALRPHSVFCETTSLYSRGGIEMQTFRTKV